MAGRAILRYEVCEWSLTKIHVQDTSRRQVLYLKSKITKGAPEAFRTMRSVPCQRLMGEGLTIIGIIGILSLVTTCGHWPCLTWWRAGGRPQRCSALWTRRWSGTRTSPGWSAEKRCKGSLPGNMSAVTCTPIRHYYIFVNENSPFKKDTLSSFFSTCLWQKCIVTYIIQQFTGPSEVREVRFLCMNAIWMIWI